MRSANKAPLLLVTTLLLGTQVWPQAPRTSSVAASGDPFVHVQETLSNAADNILATSQRLPERPQSDAVSGERPQAEKVSLRSTRQRALQRVEQLRPVIEPILREEGVPPGLIAVVLVESGGEPTALSPKGARGLWQFMPATARHYGLIVGSGTDERLDVQKSTRAAARYLRDLYQRFGDWPLALAAYNAGEDAVDTASKKARSAEFARVNSWLPLETREYVPAVLSAMGQVPILRPGRLLSGGKQHVLYAATSLE